MFRAGVTCSDCHDPHGLGLRAPGNGVCAQCHMPAKFDTPAHHHHNVNSDAARCVSCHMPARTYMVVDPRRDHSLRIPRPDLSVAIGTQRLYGVPPGSTASVGSGTGCAVVWRVEPGTAAALRGGARRRPAWAPKRRKGAGRARHRREPARHRAGDSAGPAP